LTVDQFQRRTSVVQYDKAALKNSLATLRQFTDVEGLEAHAESVAVRLRKK
jgi:histidinol dehydrogenase